MHAHRIIFMGMMNELEVTDKPRKNDDWRFQQAGWLERENFLETCVANCANRHRSLLNPEKQK